MKRRRPRKSERGFSLIEVALASFVFTVGALGLVALIYTSMEGVSVAGDVTRGTALARGKLDTLVQLPPDHADLTAGPHTDANNVDGAGVASSALGTNDGDFARSWEVIDATPAFKTITVTVRWWDVEKKMERTVVVLGGKSTQ